MRALYIPKNQRPPVPQEPEKIWVSRRENLSGQTFGRLTVLSRADDARWGGARYNCVCSCGNFVERGTGTLKSEKLVPSCGCVGLEKMAIPPPEGYTDGRVYRYNGYVSGAERRGYTWELSFEQFVTITEKPCAYCGAAPAYRATSGDFSSGIDRVDNNRGYEVGNVTPCCITCNTMKNSQPLQDFLARCHSVAQRDKHRRLAHYRAIAANFPEVGL
jgi:hypothetical protein